MNAGMDRREFLGVSMAAAELLIVVEDTQTKAMAQAMELQWSARSGG